MRKLFALFMLCLATFVLQAQRCAVLEFKAGSGISQHDVDGISAIFITYFRPSGYTMVERTQIDRVIDEQGFQRSCLTESQMVRIGKLLNVSKIVVGDINIVMKQYNVDVRVINVETGTIAATEGATFSSSSYRANMQSIAQKLASKIAIAPGKTVSPTPSVAERTEPYVIHGYLKVFPKDLGYYDSEPLTIISQLNQSHKLGYDTWRLPTKAELALMRSQNIVGSGNYMTKEYPRGIVRLVTEREKTPSGYVDLGLPSGTLWKDCDENGSYNYETALKAFGSNMPSKEQFLELKEKCIWTKTDKGYKVTGPNSNYIILSTSGFQSCDGYPTDVGSGSYYWSSSTSVSGFAWRLKVFSDEVTVNSYYSCNKYSIRLVYKN